VGQQQQQQRQLPKEKEAHKRKKSIELINTKNYTNIIKNGLLLDFLEIPKQRNKN